MLSRRSIQRLLDRSHSYLSGAQSESLVKRLNRCKADAIDAEWELIILSALDSQGSVKHEPQLGGRANLDLRFQSQVLRFIADVRALSDHIYHKDNPTHALSSALFRESKKLQKAGVEGGFAFDIRGVVSDYRKENSRPRVHLPPENRFREVLFGANFQGFIVAIKKDPTKARVHVIENGEARLAIIFSPGKSSASSGTYPAYNLPFDLKRNIVFRALEHKATQIKRAGQKGPGELAGIVLCDSGCWSLRCAASGNVVSTDAIVSNFLRDSETVDFVCIVDIPNQTRPLRFETRVWSKLSSVELKETFARAVQTLPAPVLNGVNTRNHFDSADGSERRLYRTYKRECSMKMIRQGDHTFPRSIYAG